MGVNLTKRIPTKRWARIIPIIIITNIFYFMDRQVISVALPGGMMKDLTMTANLAGFISGISAIGMLLLQVKAGKWANIGLAKRVVGISILCWSGLTFLTAFVHVSWQLILLRFVLGVSEGVVLPSITTLLTYWFPDRDGELNRAMSSYYTGNIIAMVIMGPLAGMLISSFGWRIMFVILGLISLLCGAIWAMFITERPEKAKWLSERERDYIIGVLNEEREAAKARSNIKVIDNRIPYNKILTDKYCLSLFGIAICGNIGAFGFIMWLPTILKEITRSNILNVGLLTMLPNIATFIGLWCFSYFTKKSDNRRFMTGLPMLLSALVMIMANILPLQPVLVVTMMTVAAFFMMASQPAGSTLPSLLVPSELNGPVRGLIGIASGIGSFLGPYIVGALMTMFNGSSKMAMIVLSCIMALGFVITFALPRYIGVTRGSTSNESIIMANNN
jgi:MFS family permease